MLNASYISIKISNFFKPIIDCLRCIFCCWRVRKEDSSYGVNNKIISESAVRDAEILERKISYEEINKKSPIAQDNTLISNTIQAKGNNKNTEKVSSNVSKVEISQEDCASKDSENTKTDLLDPAYNQNENHNNEEEVFSNDFKVEISQEDCSSKDSKNEQTDSSDSLLNKSKQNEEGVLSDENLLSHENVGVELSPPITSGVSDESQVSEVESVLISRKKIEINDDHIERLRKIGFDNEHLLNKDTLQTIANSGYELLTKIILNDVILDNVNEENVALLANYFYLLALVNGQEFTDGAYKIITVDKDSRAIELLFEYISNAKDVYYRPSSHMVKQSNSYAHSGIDLTGSTILPLNHKHILFTTFEDAGVTKLFFKPEHYGLSTFIDSAHHAIEWAWSVLKRVGLVSNDNDNATTVYRKERVKYLDNDKKELINEFISLLDTTIVEDTSIPLDEDNTAEYTLCHSFLPIDVLKTLNLNDMKEAVLHHGFREIARLVQLFLSLCPDDKSRAIVNNHFGSLIKKIQKEYIDYEYRSANEIIIAI